MAYILHIISHSKYLTYYLTPYILYPICYIVPQTALGCRGPGGEE